MTTYVSPSLNSFGEDRPLAFAIQVDSDAAQISYYMPVSAPGTEPPEWDGDDGFAANNIVTVPMTFAAQPGAHTLTVSIFKSHLSPHDIPLSLNRSGWLNPL